MAGFGQGALIQRFLSTSTAGGTTTLTKNSQTWQQFTGTSSQTCKLPDATTMKMGREFFIANRSTGVITIVYNDNSQAKILKPGSDISFKLFDPSTSNGVWDISNATGSGSGGSGSGGVNLGILADKNIDAEASATDWNLYDDGGATYINGTGGSPSGVSFVRTTTVGEVLNGIGSFKFSKDAANRQGQGVSIDIPVPLGYRGQPGKLNFPVKLTSGYVAGDVQMYLYDVTNGRVIQPTMPNINLPGGQQDIFQAFYYIPFNCAVLRASFFIATTSAVAYDVIFDDFGVLAIEALEAGPTQTDWQQYNMNIRGSVTDPTKATTPLVDKAFYRQDGKDMLISFEYSHTNNAGASGGSGTYFFDLPPGFLIDTEALAADNNGFSNLGSASGYHTSVGNLWGYPAYGDDRGFFILMGNESSASGPMSSTFGNITGATIYYSATVRIPILGWSAGSKTILDLPTKKVIATAGRSAVQTIPNATPTTVVFDAETEDTDGQYDPSTGIFTMKYPGDLEINTAVEWDGGGATQRIVEISKSGPSGSSSKTVWKSYAFAGNPILTGGSTIIENMLPGDQVVIKVTQSDGGNLNLGSLGSANNWVTFKRVNDRVQITPSTECSFTARLSATTGFAANAPIIFDDVVEDLTGSYNPVNGIFTCKIPGVYLAMTTLQAPTNASDGIQIFSTTRTPYVASIFNNNGIVSGISRLRLAVGDLAYVRDNSSNTFTGVIDVSHFSMVKVGN